MDLPRAALNSDERFLPFAHSFYSIPACPRDGAAAGRAKVNGARKKAAE